jgi:hypothetical protein
MGSKQKLKLASKTKQRQFFSEAYKNATPNKSDNTTPVFTSENYTNEDAPTNHAIRPQGRPRCVL